MNSPEKPSTQEADEKLRALDQIRQDGDLERYYQILAGRVDFDLSEENLVEIARQLKLDAIKRIALLTKSSTTAAALIPLLENSKELGDLCLMATSVHVRKGAALLLSDQALMEEVREKARGKDKTVFKVLDKRLAEATADGDDKAKTARTATTKPSAAQAKTAKPPAQISTIAPAPQPGNTPKKEDNFDPGAELPSLEQELGKISHKNTAKLVGIRNRLNRVLKHLPAEEASELRKNAEVLDQSLNTRMKQNQEHQQQLAKSTEELLSALKQALADGRSDDALPAWDKIQGNISNTSGDLRGTLQKAAAEHKTKIIELRDWKIFAATEKKKELIKQMQHLHESKMHAADKSKHISKLHREWKELGRSNQNEELWLEFKTISDLAYEPCKEHFKQRKQQMAENLKKRREICDQLEADVTALGESKDKQVQITDLNKLLSGSEQEWKRYAPVEQSRIKSLQKRFYGAINEIRKLRKNIMRDNSSKKKACVAEARRLAESEDQQQAMNEAKRLQQDWKSIGPTTYKEDKKYWEDFRAACDKIFEKRSQEAAGTRADLNQAEQKLNDIIKSLDSVFALDDDSFRGSRANYQDLLQEFSSALDPRLRKQRKKLLDQFNGLKRKIDTRFKTLPDKKRLALKNAVVEKSTFLDALELQLLDCKNQEAFEEAKEKLDRAGWDAFDSSAKSEYESILQDRMEQLLATDSLEALQAKATDCEKQSRELCVLLEIRANLETPAQDQSLRMQIQLSQLQQGFGQSRPDRKENAKYAMDAEMKSYCLGPLPQESRKELSGRMEQAIGKLLQ